MINKLKLKSVMAEKECSQAEIAKVLGISENSFSNKLNGKTKFYVGEAARICEHLKISDSDLKCQIFLS